MVKYGEVDLGEVMRVLSDLTDMEDYSFDHNHSCQAHEYFYLNQDEKYPMYEAQELLNTYDTEGEWL